MRLAKIFRTAEVGPDPPSSLGEWVLMGLGQGKHVMMRSIS